MNKIIFFSFPAALLFVFGFIADTPTHVHWKADRKLGWSDYRAAVPKKDTLPCFSDVVLSWQTASDDRWDYTNVTVVAYFNPQHSWSKKSARMPALLHHEQGRFSLGEIEARKFRQYVKAYSSGGLGAYIKNGFVNYRNDFNTAQAIYDQATNYGKDTAAQGNWDRRIDSLLNAYAAYPDAEFRMNAK